MDLIGSMRHRVTVQVATVARGSLGGETLTWVNSFTAYAAVDFKPTGSDEKYRAEQLTNRTAVNITIRREGRTVSAKDRLTFDSVVYEIDSVLPTGDHHEYLLLECFQIGEHKVVVVQGPR